MRKKQREEAELARKLAKLQKPPVAEPPVSEPPVAEPPVAEPPVAEPQPVMLEITETYSDDQQQAQPGVEISSIIGTVENTVVSS
jgi:hypothetical protein